MTEGRGIWVGVLAVAITVAVTMNHHDQPMAEVRPIARPPTTSAPATPVPAPVADTSAATEPAGRGHVWVPVPIPVGHDNHRGWVHRKVCRHTIFC